MYRLVFGVCALVACGATPALAQSNESSLAGVRIDGSTLGILATTPSRMSGSREEMNRGRSMNWAANPTPTQLRRAATDALGRANLECTVVAVDLVAQMLDQTPIIEVGCEEAAGVVIVASDPVQFSHCKDLVGSTDVIRPCRIRRNVELVNAARP
jgi:hypothetical protein